MTMREILDIVYLSLYAIVILATIMAFVIRLIKNSKASKKVSEENESEKQKVKELENCQKVYDFVRDSMLKVENYLNYTDVEKSEFVKNEVRSVCSSLGIEFAKVDVDKIISYFMDVANGINKRGTESKKTR